MTRNKLSMKKANMISSASKSATSNPFIIFDFYDVLDKLVKEKKLKALQIWNCDESGFPNDPQKCKVVGVRGKTAYKVTWGAGRENPITIAVCNAAGRVLDPLCLQVNTCSQLGEVTELFQAHSMEFHKAAG